jgi:hypothetical protein
VKLREDITVFPLKSLYDSAGSKPEPLDAQVRVRVRVERLEHEAAHDLECGPTITGAVFCRPISTVSVKMCTDCSGAWLDHRSCSWFSVKTCSVPRSRKRHGLELVVAPFKR